MKKRCQLDNFMISVYNDTPIFAIHKIRHEVRKRDMNILMNSHVHYNTAGRFKADGEWRHPDRTERTYELIVVTDSAVYLHDVALGELCLKKGQAVLLSPNVRHYGTVITENTEFYWLHFSLTGGKLPFQGRVFSRFEPLYLFRELLHLGNLPKRPQDAINAVTVHILCELSRMENDTQRFDRKGEEIYEWIRIHARSGLSAEKVAAHFGFSKDHVTRILKGNFGCGVKALSARFLMENACNLLANTDLYIKEISARLGFRSDKAFVNFFYYHEGCYPTQFRNRLSKTHLNNH